MTQRHKHADLIIAWANGAQIQWQDPHDKIWCDIAHPGWGPYQEYRIKPEPKPDVVRYRPVLTLLTVGDPAYYYSLHSSVILTSFAQWEKVIFDGETGKVKSIELLK